MGKQDQGSAAAEGTRRATGGAADRGRGGRFSVRRKREIVLRLLRGEDLESVSRELRITAARASQWRKQFLAAGQAGLKSRAMEASDEDPRRLRAKIDDRCGRPSVDVAYCRSPRPATLAMAFRTSPWNHTDDMDRVSGCTEASPSQGSPQRSRRR